MDDESAPAPTATLIELCADHGITTDEVTVVVPDVTSRSWPVAQHRLEEERLVAVAAERDQVFLGPEAADFVVVRQNPAAGERVPVDSRIWLTLYRPPGSSAIACRYPRIRRPTPGGARSTRPPD